MQQDRLAVVGDSAIVVPRLLIPIAAQQEGKVPGRIETDGCIAIRDGAVVVSMCDVAEGAKDKRARILGAELDRLVLVGDCSLGITLQQVRKAAAGERR